MRRYSVFAVLLPIAVASGPAVAAPETLSPQWKACAENSSASQRVDACQAVIGNGGLGNEDLASAYRWLGDAYRAQAYEARDDIFAEAELADRARDAYDKSLEANPSDPKTYERRASLREDGDIEGAIADYSKAIELGTTDTTAFSARSQYYEKQGDLAQAIADLSGAIKLSPSGYYYRRRALLNYKHRAYDAALADLALALKKDPSKFDAAKIYQLQGRIYAEMGKPTDAIAAFANSEKVGSASILMRYHRALAYSSAGDVENAVSEFGSVIDEGSKTSGVIEDFVHGNSIAYSDLVGPAYAGRALAFARVERNAEALQDAHRAVELAPENTAVLQVRAAVHEQMGNNKEAIADYQKVLSIAPSNSVSREGLQRLGVAP